MASNLIREVGIRGFRAFPDFTLHSLGRINLLVGRNNSGKSSILEAIQIASSFGDPYSLWSIMSRRGEQVWDEAGAQPHTEADVSHLYHGHQANPGTEFSIQQRRESSDDLLIVGVQDAEELEDSQRSLFNRQDADEFASPLAFKLTWFDGVSPPTFVTLPLSRRGGLSATSLRRLYRTPPRRNPIQLITTAALSLAKVVSLFDDIVLTPEEDHVIEALRTIEPSVERIAIATSRRRATGMDRGGVVLKCKGVPQRIPIGSMGDGIWRMLGLALALVRSENGILLVDEIDTGLHFTVMDDMWRLIHRNARRLNVQVFATTHSRDCYESLSAIVCSDDVGHARDDVTIQRIEREKKRSVEFSGREIVVAAQRAIEVR